jgi:hypothetical protein
MRLLHSFATVVLTCLFLAVDGDAQTKRESPKQASTPTEAMTGILRTISTTEADLDGIDTDFKPQTIVFVVTPTTDLSSVQKNDTVKIIYETRNSKNIALSIKVIQKATPLAQPKQAPTPATPSEAGGVSEVIPPAPAPVPISAPVTDNQPQQFASNEPPNANSLALEDVLQQQFPVTKITSDRSDIVVAGAVLKLHKDGLIMTATPSASAWTNVYTNGMLQSSSAENRKKAWIAGLLKGDRSTVDSTGAPQRKFVAGEKFWVTGFQVKKDAVVLNVYSDPYNDVRYYGELKFPITRSASPSSEDILKTINEVVSVEPADDKDRQLAQNSSVPAAPPASPAPQQAIGPPPPPDAPPPTPIIAIGQTKDQVVAGFGQPVRIAKLGGNKEIYFYKDMKVTFTNGRVSNVE